MRAFVACLLAASCGGEPAVEGETPDAAAADLATSGGPDLVKLLPLADLALPRSDLTRVYTGCYGTVKCVNLCGEDGGCRANCLLNTTMKGRALYDALEKCLDTACPYKKPGDVCESPTPACQACYAKAQQMGGTCFNQKVECYQDM
jgi:hypothetical protein